MLLSLIYSLQLGNQIGQFLLLFPQFNGSYCWLTNVLESKLILLLAQGFLQEPLKTLFEIDLVPEILVALLELSYKHLVSDV